MNGLPRDGAARGRRGLVAAVAALALAPYAGVAATFEDGLKLQAATIVAILALLAAAAGRRMSAGLRGLPPVVLCGLVLYLGAAAWGAAVGVVSDNPVRYVVSQSLAMALLPAGACAFAAHPAFGGRELARGLAIAALVALAVHALALAVPWIGSTLGASDVRLALRYAIGFSASGVAAVLVAGACALGAGSLLAGAGGLAALVHVAGAMSRGAWASTAVGLLIVVTALLTRMSRRLLASAAAGTAALATLLAAAVWWSDGTAVARYGFDVPAGSDAGWTPSTAARSGGGAAAMTLAAGRRHPLTAALPVTSPIVVVSCWVRGEEGRRASLWVRARDGDGRAVRSFAQRVVGSSRWDQVGMVVQLPPGSVAVQIGLSGRDGRWLVDDLDVTALSGSLPLVVRRLRDRLGSIGSAVARPEDDETLSYRFGELEAVMQRWRAAGAVRLAVGHGLGARFAFSNAGWSPEGRRIALPESSYIHNFYVFLGFKLGIAGLAALAGLLMVAGSAAVAAWRLRERPAESWIHVAAAAVWAAYLLWGLTSPEVIDFRVAPLLGALIAASRRSPAAVPTGA